MTGFQAFLLGLIQGLTEFLPVSSSGHLELGNYFLKIGGADNLRFSVTVHAATVLSTLFVFRKDILQLITGSLQNRKGEEIRYLIHLIVSSVPIAFVGIFLKKHVESLFTENLILIGCSLLVTAALLSFAHFRKNEQNRKIGIFESLIIGFSQALAVIPGISRSGATIATGLLLGINRKEVARFSFLMVMIPIIGGFLLEILRGGFSENSGPGIIPLTIGFTAAFFSGLFACRLMIRLVTRGNLIYFAVYCLVIALFAIFAG